MAKPNAKAPLGQVGRKKYVVAKKFAKMAVAGRK